LDDLEEFFVIEDSRVFRNFAGPEKKKKQQPGCFG